MKKRFLLCLLLALALCLSLGGLASAEEPSLGYVTDAAGILSAEEAQALADRAAAISEQYQYGVYLVTVADYRDYNSYGVENAAEDIYRYYSLGWGESQDGILLLLSMDDRDYDLAAYGDFGNYAFTDYGKEQLAGEFLDNFRRNDWYGGFSDYLETAASLLAQARNGTPVDIPGYSGSEYNTRRTVTPFDLVLIIGLPCLVAFLVCSRFKRQMKTARERRGAEDYVRSGGVDLRIKQDQFTHRTQTVRVIETENRSSGGHGGTTVNSGGFSHHSGKF